MKQVIEVPVFSEANKKRGLPISPVVKAGGFIFVSGTPPLDLQTAELVKGDIAVQTRASLKALEHCLKAAGASFDDVVQVRIYAVNSGMFFAINEVYKEFFKSNFPVRTFVPVASWPMEFDVEIECMAVARS